MDADLSPTHTHTHHTHSVTELSLSAFYVESKRTFSALSSCLWSFVSQLQTSSRLNEAAESPRAALGADTGGFAWEYRK